MPTRRSPRLSVTILLTILAGLFAALVGLLGNLATSAIPPAITPYLRFAWPALGIVVVLSIGVSVWQVRREVTASSSLPPALQRTALPSSASTPAQQRNSPSDYHTCALSYATEDQPFAEKLRVTLTTPALASLLGAKIQVTYLSKYGQYLGSLSPQLTKNSILRLAQHAAHVDAAKRHTIAQRFVIGKLRNMRTILMRYQRTQNDSLISRQLETLKQCVRAAGETKLDAQDNAIEWHEIDDIAEKEQTELGKDRMNGLGSLLGCEGAGSAAYFHVFDRLIKCDWEHGFSKRVRRPPTDPVNAMLSYGYTILTGQVASALASVGFDPYIGYLHASRYGKPALALDLMEEFRPVIVDSVVLNLLNNRQLEPKDFVLELNSYRMTETTKRLFLQKFEDRMQEVVSHPVFEYKVTYRRCIELQARLLAKYVTGEVPQYTPFVVR